MLTAHTNLNLALSILAQQVHGELGYAASLGYSPLLPGPERKRRAALQAERRETRRKLSEQRDPWRAGWRRTEAGRRVGEWKTEFKQLEKDLHINI